jgi:hypothetical protein
MKLPKLPYIKIKSFPFISSLILFLVVSSAVIFVPSSSWKKIFSGRFNIFTAVFSSTPNPGTYIAGNSIRTIIPDASGGVYIGGDFTSIRPNVNHGVPVTVSNGLAVSTFPRVNNNIWASVEDHSGGWYIGGDFTTVGTASRSRIAHILSNGTVDPDFNPGADQGVYALRLSSDGSILYMGGAFLTVAGSSRNALAAVHTSDGSIVTTFDPEPNSIVYALSLSPDQNTLYVGGQFSLVGTTTRNKVASVSTSDGSLITDFDPDVSNGSAVSALALSSDGSLLYFGGDFTTVSATTRNRVAAADTSNGSLEIFDPNAGGAVFSLALSSDDNTLYMGGSFNTVNGGTTRHRIAAVDASDGSVISAFDPDVNVGAYVWTLSLSSDQNTLYMGGNYTQVGGTTRNRISAVNTSDGSLVASFNPNANDEILTTSLSANGSRIYVGGVFTQLGTVNRNRIAHILSDGSVDPNFDPNANGGVDALVLSPGGGTLYMGGFFTTVGISPRNYVAAVDTSTGSTTGFDSNANSFIRSLAISTSGTVLYMGGDFTTLDGGATTRNHIAAVDASDGSVISAFDPDANNVIVALALSGSTLYMGGGFTSIGTTSRNYIAAVDTSDGSVITAFDPNLDFLVWTLALSGSTLYLGGDFSLVGTTTRNHVAAVNTTNGSVVTAFDPDVTGSTVSSLAITSDGSTLYIGGGYTTVGTSTRNNIAGVSTSDGLVTAFNPGTNTGSIVQALALSLDENTLYIGGNFTTVGGEPHSFFASFLTSFTTPASRRRTIPTADTTPPVITITGGTPVTVVASSTYNDLGATAFDDVDGATTVNVISNNVNTNVIGSYSVVYSSSDYSGNVATATRTVNVINSTTTASTTVATTTIPAILPVGFCFNNNLKHTDSGPDVKNLQIFLNNQGFNTTIDNYYSTETVNSVIKFQIKYNINPAQGVFGNVTRNKANELLGCPTPTIPVVASTTPPEPAPEPTPVPTPPTPTNNPLSNIIDSISQSYNQALLILGDNMRAIGEIVNSPSGSVVTKTISTAAIVLASFLALGSIAFATPITFSEIWFIPGRIFSLLMGALGIRRKTRPWGTVYDSVTKRPLDPVYVTLIDTRTNKEVSSAITDLDGRYGFLVVPGKYKILAQKTNYAFPSQKMSTKLFDEVYNDLYFGAEITVTTEEETITKNIPMDSLSFDWNEFAKNKSNINTFIRGRDITWAKISKTVFFVGAIVSLIALIFAPRPYNLIIAILYVVAYIFNYFVFKVKKPGTIIEESTGLPLSFAIVKIFREGMPDNTPVVKKITDKYGRYYSLVPKGDYYLEVEMKNNDESYTQVFKSNVVHIEKGIINEDFAVQIAHTPHLKKKK